MNQPFYTRIFPGLCSALADCLPVRDTVLDGEIVHLDADGKPQFISSLRRRQPQQFVAFDLLWLDKEDLTRKPLIERKRLLRSVVPGEAPVIYADHVDGAGRELYWAVCEMDLEGIVAKRKDGLYPPGLGERPRRPPHKAADQLAGTV